VLWRAAGGEPLAALALAEQGVSAEVWQSLPRQLAQGDARLLSTWPLPQALRTLQQLCHDLMAVGAGGAPRYFPAGSLPAGALDWPALSAWSQELQRLCRHDEHPWNASLLLEAQVARASALFQAPNARRPHYT
jgi:DNA polymerase-3 subunit delta'